jgi:hypothetical protein
MSSLGIKITEDGEILRFTFTGPSTYANLVQAAATVNAETKSRGMWLVLCDTTAMSAPAGAFEKFEAGAELARGADPRVMIAVVAPIEAIDYIFENVARNRGVEVSVFRSEGAALKWLSRKRRDQ